MGSRAESGSNPAHRASSTILLVRHGEPEGAIGPWLDYDAYVQLARNYRESRLKMTSQPPTRLVARVQTASLVINSGLPRTRETTERLGVALTASVERPEMEEVQLPLPPWLPGQLSMTVWYLARRLLWEVGLGDGEHRSAAARRAASNAVGLAAEAHNHGVVALIGHGMMNSMVSRALRQSGWVGERLRAWPYWGWEELTFAEEDARTDGAFRR